MNIDFSEELEAFRREVADFLDTAPTPAIREAGRKTTSVFAPFKEVMAWHRILHAKGWSAPAWPVEYGGTGWSVEQRYIFAEEHWKRDLPPLLPNGLQMVGPLIMELGTPEQKALYLPGILAGEDYWTQGYSEPNAGSDLASLSCSAVADGDDYIINGQKIWTTLAHEANRMFMLVRTNKEAKKQAGITFLLLDRMDYPGMVVRPIIGLDGLPEQCEVFFDNVRVPQSGRVGAENDGWSVAKQLLKHERGGAALSPMLRRKMALIRQAVVDAPSPHGGTLADDPIFQRDLGEVEAELVSYEAFERMILTGHPIGNDPAMPSLNKIMSTEMTQLLGVMQARVAGLGAVPQQVEALTVDPAAEPLDDLFSLTAMPFYLNARATSIYAGTNEIQRDLLARTLNAA
ncbi:acyl-CoA dehydrogenase family protein [Sphingobium sp. HBC34]|uniref:Acyl-CoA dehydrogenase family protein n=1 Tax=Sphingobium cyanobacteriorum TaxID=3063954 RepID=A0ABT8ZQF9_9SPHN|nr:acyl-CoA dehydrogenase family protein [Sphingobium sp. HBC34]MDO7836437.1 acyl-CoA dehydrogenase family protein [Sphingobium sp. HBC34]